jgi:hypothetical protein
VSEVIFTPLTSVISNTRPDSRGRHGENCADQMFRTGILVKAKGFGVSIRDSLEDFEDVFGIQNNSLGLFTFSSIFPFHGDAHDSFFSNSRLFSTATTTIFFSLTDALRFANFGDGFPAFLPRHFFVPDLFNGFILIINKEFGASVTDKLEDILNMPKELDVKDRSC